MVKEYIQTTDDPEVRALPDPTGQAGKVLGVNQSEDYEFKAFAATSGLTIEEYASNADLSSTSTWTDWGPSVSITTTGAPVLMFAQFFFESYDPGGGAVDLGVRYRIVRVDSPDVIFQETQEDLDVVVGSPQSVTLFASDTPAAGTHTYKLQAYLSTASAAVQSPPEIPSTLMVVEWVPTSGGGVSESEITYELTGDEAPLAPTGWSEATHVELTTDGGSSEISGLDSSATVVRKTIVNASAAYDIVLKHMNALSSADNIIGPGADLVLGPGDIVSVYYSTAASAWRVY